MSPRMALAFIFFLAFMLQTSGDYPTKPVRIIEPFGAGGGPDIISSRLSPKLTELWGQPVTVENLPARGVQRRPLWLRSCQPMVTRCSSTPALRHTAPCC